MPSMLFIIVLISRSVGLQLPVYTWTYPWWLVPNRHWKWTVPDLDLLYSRIFHSCCDSFHTPCSAQSHSVHVWAWCHCQPWWVSWQIPWSRGWYVSICFYSKSGLKSRLLKLALVFILIVEVVLVWVGKHCGMAGRHWVTILEWITTC